MNIQQLDLFMMNIPAGTIFQRDDRKKTQWSGAGTCMIRMYMVRTEYFVAAAGVIPAEAASPATVVEVI